MPLEKLLASYGIRIGPDGTKQRIIEEPDPAIQTAGPSDTRSDVRSMEQLDSDATQKRRQSPRIRQQSKPDSEEAVHTAVKPEPAADDFIQPATPAPASPADAQMEKVTPLPLAHHVTSRQCSLVVGTHAKCRSSCSCRHLAGREQIMAACQCIHVSMQILLSRSYCKRSTSLRLTGRWRKRGGRVSVRGRGCQHR